MNGDPVDPDQDIEVEPLPEPTPPPFGADELAEPGPGPAEQLGADQAVARIIEPAIGAPFYLAGLWLGRGLPTDARRLVRLAWRVTHDDLSPIAQALAPLVPADFLASRAAQVMPGAAALLMLVALIEERATATADIRRQYEGAPTDGRSDQTDPPPATRAGRRRAGAAAAGQPGTESAPPGGRSFEGAGLGLVGDEPGVAPAGPPERP